MKDAERRVIADQTRADSAQFHTRLAEVAGGSIAPATLLRAIENTIAATGEEIPNVYGTDALAMAYARITQAAAAAKIAGVDTADYAHQQIRAAYIVERDRRNVAGGPVEAAARRAFKRHRPARETRDWYDLTGRERREWTATAAQENRP